MSSEPSLALSDTAYAGLLALLEERSKSEAARRGLDWSALMAAGEEHSPARQALTILRWGLFDANWYLATYADVAAAGFDPLTHYVNLGDAEGRRPNAFFDPVFYRAQFGETVLRSVTALYHYAVMGEAIGLGASGAFSARRYLVSNPSLQPWLDRPLTHFLHLGRQGGLMSNLRARVAGEQKVRFAKSALPAPAQRGKAAAINLIGPLDRVSGLGVSARGYLDGLRLADVLPIGCRAQQKEFSIQKSIGGSGAFPSHLPDAPINLVHMNGDTLPVMIQETGDGFLKGRYNIAVWYWELPTLRPEWQASTKYFHEFWAPTPFIARTLRQSTAKPVHLIPPYLAYLKELTSKAVMPTRASAHFVYCFDANSILERKNPGALLEAFRQAFPQGSREVRLTFKVTYPNRALPEVQRLYAAAAEDSRIEVIDRLIPDAELHALIASATAYVSPHRSEGLGLTVIEAMGAGVPVVSTGFGGVDAFVSEATAFPIAHHPTELPDDYFPYPRAYVWAEPDVDSLARQLRRVLDEPQEAAQRAQAARRRVLDYFTSEQLIDTYRSRLSALVAELA